MGVPNHILQHVPSDNPTQNPTTGPPPFGVMAWYGVAPLWPPTTYKACQTPFICMNRIWYEYEVDANARSQSSLQHVPSERPSEIPTTTSVIVKPSMYQVGVASLTPSHSIVGAELCVYKEDLI